MLTFALAGGSFLIGLIRAIYEMVWGAAPRLEKIERALAIRRERERIEGQRFTEESAKIQAQPKATGKDLEEKVNRTFKEFGQ